MLGVSRSIELSGSPPRPISRATKIRGKRGEAGRRQEQTDKEKAARGGNGEFRSGEKRDDSRSSSPGPRIRARALPCNPTVAIRPDAAL